MSMFNTTSVVFSNANRMTFYTFDPNIRYYLLKVIDCCPAGHINHLEANSDSFVLDDGQGTIGFFNDSFGGTRKSDANYANQSGSDIIDLNPLPGQPGPADANLASNEGAWSWVPSETAEDIITPENLNAVTRNVAVVGPPLQRKPLVYYIENFVWNGNRTDYLIMKADKGVIDPCTGQFNGTLKLRFKCYKPCEYARTNQENSDWQTLDIFQIAGVAGTIASRQKGPNVSPRQLGERAAKNGLYFHQKNSTVANYSNDADAYQYERILGKEIKETVMIDFPIGATLEFQIVGGYGSRRTVSLSHSNCLILNGYNGYSYVTLNENYNAAEWYLPELSSFAPQFSLEAMQGNLPSDIFPRIVLDRALSDGSAGPNRNHVFSVKCKDLGATTIYISDEEGCTIAYNINVVASWCVDWTEGLESSTGLDRTAIADQRHTNLRGINQDTIDIHQKWSDLGKNITTWEDRTKLYGHITTERKTSQVPLNDDWAFLRYQYNGVAGDEHRRADASKAMAWCDCEVRKPSEVGLDANNNNRTEFIGDQYPVGKNGGWETTMNPNTYMEPKTGNDQLMFFCGMMKNCRTYIDGSRNPGTFQSLWDEEAPPKVNNKDFTYIDQIFTDSAMIPSYRWVDLTSEQSIEDSEDIDDIYKINITKTIGDGRGYIMRWGMDYGFGVNKMRVYLPEWFTKDTEGRRVRWEYQILRRGGGNSKATMKEGGYSGAGWTQFEKYEGSMGDQSFVRVGTNRNLGYVDITFKAPTNFLPVVIRFKRNIYRANGVSRSFDVNNLFPQDNLVSPHSIVVGSTSVIGENDGNGNLNDNLILSRKLFQLSGGRRLCSNLYSKPIESRNFGPNRRYAFSSFTQADLFVSSMCINPQAETFVAHETLDGSQHFINHEFEENAEFPIISTNDLSVTDPNTVALNDKRLLRTDFIPFIGKGLFNNVLQGGQDVVDLNSYFKSSDQAGMLAGTVIDFGPINDNLEREFKLLLAIHGEKGLNFGGGSQQGKVSTQNNARVFLANHLYFDEDDIGGDLFGVIQDNPLSIARTYHTSLNAKIYQIDIKLNRRRLSNPKTKHGMLFGKIPGFIQLECGNVSSELHYIFGKVGKFNTKINDDEAKMGKKIGDAMYNAYMKAAQVESQFNTNAQAPDNTFEEKYRDLWNGLFTQPRGASSIIPFVLTYIKMDLVHYDPTNNALTPITGDDKGQQVWAKYIISKAQTIKETFKSKANQIHTNLNEEMLKQGLGFNGYWKILPKK